MPDSRPEQSPIGQKLFTAERIPADEVNPDSILDALTRCIRSLEFHAETPAACVDWDSLEIEIEQDSHTIYDIKGALIRRTVSGPFTIRTTVDVLEA